MNNSIGSIILEAAPMKVEDVVVSDISGSSRVIAEGILQDLDKENRNHRIYSKKDIAPEINGPRMTELINAGMFRGEMGHPLSDSIVRQQTIDPKLVAAQYLKVWIEGDLVKGQFKGTNNEYGEFFDKDLREGNKPSFSLRALGTIENINGKAYVKNIKVITYDVVIFPSHRAAYTSKVITESAMSDGTLENAKSVNIDHNTKIIEETNRYGRIINLKGPEANSLLNRLQRESANISSIIETFEGVGDDLSLCNGKLRMSTKDGDKIYLNTDEYVDNLITNYVYGM